MRGRHRRALLRRLLVQLPWRLGLVDLTAGLGGLLERHDVPSGPASHLLTANQVSGGPWSS